jgi:hypothetical protein
VTHARGEIPDADDIAYELRDLVSTHAPDFAKSAELVEDHIVVIIPKDDPTLYVNFRYNSTDQICTANVRKTPWDAFTWHLSKEEAMLLLGGDIEISDHYTADDITVDDVMTQFEIYNG